MPTVLMTMSPCSVLSSRDHKVMDQCFMEWRGVVQKSKQRIEAYHKKALLLRCFHSWKMEYVTNSIVSTFLKGRAFRAWVLCIRRQNQQVRFFVARKSFREWKVRFHERTKWRMFASLAVRHYLTTLRAKYLQLWWNKLESERYRRTIVHQCDDQRLRQICRRTQEEEGPIRIRKRPKTPSMKENQTFCSNVTIPRRLPCFEVPISQVSQLSQPISAPPSQNNRMTFLRQNNLIAKVHEYLQAQISM